MHSLAPRVALVRFAPCGWSSGPTGPTGPQLAGAALGRAAGAGRSSHRNTGTGLHAGGLPAVPFSPEIQHFSCTSVSFPLHAWMEIDARKGDLSEHLF